MRAATYAVRPAAPLAAGPAPTASRALRAPTIGNQAILRRTPCKSEAECKIETPGDPGKFGEEAEAKIKKREEALKAAPAGSKDAGAWARRSQPATHFLHLMQTHGVQIGPQIKSYFLDPRLDGVAGGVTTNCSEVVGGTPSGLKDDDKCASLPLKVEDKAESVDITGPLTPEQDDLVSKLLRIAVHEEQHARFEKNQGDDATKITPDTTGKGAADAGCNQGKTDELISEISAESAEFPIVFKRLAEEPGSAHAAETTERKITFQRGESINGAIVKLKCLCDCDRADEMIVKTIEFTTASWPADQKQAFLAAMTRMLPNDWPAALRVKT